MPVIKLHRENQFADKIRSYQIFVDEIQIGEIKSGSTKEFYVVEGTHKISLKIDWCGSGEIEFSIANEETIEFECGNNTHLFLAFFYVLFARNKYLWLRKRQKFD